MGEHGSGRVEYAAGVHRQQPCPLGVGDILEQHPGQADAGVAHKGVQVAESLKHRVHHGTHLVRIGHIGLDGEASVVQLPAEGFCGPLGLEVVDRHLIAACGKAAGGGGADAPAGAGD